MMLLTLTLPACEPSEVGSDSVAAEADALTIEADAVVEQQINDMGQVELWTSEQAETEAISD